MAGPPPSASTKEISRPKTNSGLSRFDRTREDREDAEMAPSTGYRLVEATEKLATPHEATPLGLLETSAELSVTRWRLHDEISYYAKYRVMP